MEEKNIKTENRLATMEQKIDNLIDDVKELSNDIKALDTKYSGKWVEKLTIAIAGGLIVAVFGGIVLYFINN